MSKTLKFLIYIIAVLLVSGSSYAAAFDAAVTPVKDKIVVDEVAEFGITIRNNLDTTEDFTIKKAGYPFWDMYTKPIQNPITLRVPPNSNQTFRLFVNPLYITSVDTYTLEIGVIRVDSAEELRVPITIGIKSTEPLIGGYIPTVIAAVSLSSENIDPREDLNIRVSLNNQNVINYTNLTLRVDSNLFREEIYFPLGPKEDKVVEVMQNFDDSASPQQDKLVISVLKDDRIIVNPIVREFGIKEYVVQEQLPKESSFLKIRSRVKIFSNNHDYKGSIRAETTPFKNLFTSAYPRAESVKEGGKHYLVWQVELDDKNTMMVYTAENYRPLVVILVLGIIAIILYFLFRSPIVVRKSIANVGMSEGGISQAKVVVRVKNRSPGQITGIEVIDHVPHIAHVEKELSIGSMQPHAILQHPKRGVMIKWNVEVLEAGDERVLSYKMISRLPILGEFNLPSATARAKVGNKLILTNSNRVSVGG